MKITFTYRTGWWISVTLTALFIIAVAYGDVFYGR